MAFFFFHPRAKLPLFVLTCESFAKNKFLSDAGAEMDSTADNDYPQQLHSGRLQRRWKWRRGEWRSLASLKAISICIMNGASPFQHKPVELRPWGQFPSNSIKTNRQRVLGRMVSKCELHVPGGVARNECSTWVSNSCMWGQSVVLRIKMNS